MIRAALPATILVAAMAGHAHAQPKAFPSAEGFGANAKGGRAGRVIEVTNLTDSATAPAVGSLRACVQATGARTCVFRVGGTITLAADLVVREANSFLTIAGHTAPGGGIQVKNGGLKIILGAHDVVVRHFKIRAGTDHRPQDINNECTGILVYGPSTAPPVRNVIIDHASVSWVCDDTVASYSAVENLTVQWSLVGEGLIASDYQTTAGDTANSKGGLTAGVGSRSYHHNLYVHTSQRNPLAKGRPGDTVPPLLDWRYNVVYNWGACHSNTALGEYHEYGTPKNDASIRVNFVGNKYIAGPDTPLTGTCGFGRLGGNNTKVYISNNVNPFCKTGCSSVADMKFFAQDPNVTGTLPPYPLATDAAFRVSTPFAAPAVTATPLSSLESAVAATAGASKPSRDALDARLVQELQTRTGDLGRRGQPYPALSNGTPPLDSDRDGMPDAWERLRGLNPASAADGAQVSSNGYTYLENYLNELAGDQVPAWTAGGLSVSFAAPTPQTFHVTGTVSAGAPRVETQVIIKATNAVKVELSRDASTAACPTCGTPFRTWTAPTSSTDTYAMTWCVNCFNSTETLPRTTVLHATAYDAAGQSRRVDVSVTVTNATRQTAALQPSAAKPDDDDSQTSGCSSGSAATRLPWLLAIASFLAFKRRRRTRR